MQQKLADERKQQEWTLTQQQELARVKRLETLREHHHTTQREDSLWQTVLNTLREQVSGITFKAYLAQSVLLSLQEGQALIAVPNGFVKQWLKERLAVPIRAALASHLAGQARPLRRGGSFSRNPRCAGVTGSLKGKRIQQLTGSERPTAS